MPQYHNIYTSNTMAEGGPVPGNSIHWCVLVLLDIMTIEGQLGQWIPKLLLHAFRNTGTRLNRQLARIIRICQFCNGWTHSFDCWQAHDHSRYVLSDVSSSHVCVSRLKARPWPSHNDTRSQLTKLLFPLLHPFSLPCPASAF